MCAPSIASKIARAVKDNQGLEGVNLNNIKDVPRQFALGVSLSLPNPAGKVIDVTKARPM
jgi:hypothetical protein